MKRCESSDRKRKASFNAHGHSPTSARAWRLSSFWKSVRFITGVLLNIIRVENSKSSIDHTKLLTNTTTSGQVVSSAIRTITQQVQATTTQNVAYFESISKQTADHQENQEISNWASKNLRQDLLVVGENLGNGNVQMQKKLDSTSQTLDLIYWWTRYTDSRLDSPKSRWDPWHRWPLAFNLKFQHEIPRIPVLVLNPKRKVATHAISRTMREHMILPTQAIVLDWALVDLLR